MRQLKKVGTLILLLLITMASPIWPGTTGKIAGVITDKSTGDPLIGANIIILGTSLGAATDLDGRYTILEVPPGVYQVQITYIGYRKILVDDIRVFIDQTARVDVQLESEAVEVGELVVVAERQLIKPDVATSVTAVSGNEIKELPVASVMGAVNLQAGVRNGMIRGGGNDRILLMLNGVTLRDPRNNNATGSIALSAVKEVSVERGGFNAEYGQVQNGIINVVTREGGRSNYSGRFQFRYSPPARKYWNGSPEIKDISDPMSYALRPFFDDDVCWTGTTNGTWDEYTRKQYPTFEGWNEISRKLNQDNDPNNDLTPAGAQRVFEYEVRKRQPNNQPDFDLDAGFGGPVPLISEMLGDLRFYASYRGTRDMLIWPLTRTDYRDYDATVQVNSDINKDMRLKFSVLTGKQYTMRQNWDNLGSYNYIHYPNEVAQYASAVNTTIDLTTLFSDYNFPLTDISHRSLSAKFTHTLNSKTFYEVSLENFRVAYNTAQSGTVRDTSTKYEIIPGFYEDSNPFGFIPGNTDGIVVIGGNNTALPRDFSVVNTYTLKADFTSQVNFQNLLKAGVEVNYNDLNFDYGTVLPGTANTFASRTKMEVFPIRGAAYLQDKLETKEFILNAGLRLDYTNSNGHWYDVDPWNKYFYSTQYSSSLEFQTSDDKAKWSLSPRLGIAHPITENAKLFFNYGHFLQVPNYENMFRIQRTYKNDITGIGNPNLVLSKTISYELGFDYSVSDEILIQLAAYYNDVTDQQNTTTYNSASSGFSYGLTTANNYEDTRGFELTIRKTTGKWFTGFANYTYSVTSSGHFGSARQYDDISQQRQYDAATLNLYQDRPIPQPYARANLTFFSPDDFGPEILGHKILSGFLLNLLVDWQAGYWVTWNPYNLSSVSHNVQSVDYFNVDLRLDKEFVFGKFNVDLFMDMTNVLNTKRLWNTGDQYYLESLHLPKSDAYPNIPGDDKIGDYRKPGVEYQPMEYQQVIDPTKPGKERAMYYEGSTGKYWQYNSTSATWSLVDNAKLNQVLEDKAYIDMPNASTFWFLNPRDIFFGIRVSFNISD